MEEHKKSDLSHSRKTDESMHLIEVLNSENYVGKWEPEFISLYEKALLNSLWEKGLLSQDEYEWCLEELNSRSKG